MALPQSTGSANGAGDTAGAAKESGQAVAGSAANHARDLAGTASDKASDVIGEAKSHAGDLLDTTREQITAEADNRRGQAVSSLRGLGDELQSMQDHDGRRGVATEFAGRSTGYVRQAADYLDRREPSQILDDVRQFARERPGTFLLGAVVAGVVAGRFTRAVKAGPPSGSEGFGPNSAGAPTAAFTPSPAGLPLPGTAEADVRGGVGGTLPEDFAANGDEFVSDGLTAPAAGRGTGT